jgi:hypothetical protein
MNICILYVAAAFTGGFQKSSYLLLWRKRSSVDLKVSKMTRRNVGGTVTVALTIQYNYCSINKREMKQRRICCCIFLRIERFSFYLLFCQLIF